MFKHWLTISFLSSLQCRGQAFTKLLCLVIRQFGGYTKASIIAELLPEGLTGTLTEASTSSPSGCQKAKKKSFRLNAKQVIRRVLVFIYNKLAGQPGVARAFALRAEVCRCAPQAPLSFLASQSLHPEVNTLPYEENCSSIVELA